MSYWNEKVVLVTGGSAGLGRAVAEAFARDRARLVIAARDSDRLHAAADAIRTTAASCEPIVADVTRDADVARMVDRTIELYGRLDVLVNSVGQSMRGLAAETSIDDYQNLFDANFLTAVRCVRTALPHLRSTRGHIVNIGSLASKVATRYLGAYPASKFALAAYSQQLRLELADYGLHVLLVCPGPLARDDFDQRYDEAARDLPASAARPGGGARVKALDPHHVAERIVRACQRRQAELVLPGKARLLFALAELSPHLGDWIVKRFT